MKIFIKIMTVFFALSIVPPSGLACSVLTLSDAQETLTGYTMDWPGQVAPAELGGDPFMGGGVFLLERGLTKKSPLIKGSTFQWTSRYRSLILSILGPSYGFNGINEVGLEVYELGPPSLNRDPQSTGPTISEGDLLALILDQAQTTDEAVALAKSIKMEQYLFPIQYYIKDRSGSVVILDYKDGLRVHVPEKDARTVTNFYFDRERMMLENGSLTEYDQRFSYIAKNGKTPADMDKVITAVGTTSNTLWQTFSSVKGQDVFYTIRVNSKRTPDPELTKDLTLELKTLFAKESYLAPVQFFLFSDILTPKTVQFRELTNSDLQKIQKVNLYNIGRWSDLFTRNEERDSEIWNNFLNLSKAVEIAPF